MLLPMLPRPRVVDPEWKCHRSGDCCTIPAEVVMTREERLAILRAVPPGVQSEWRDVDETFVAVKAKPCPFFIFNGCVVYHVRPYNCRRFACMRPDVKVEPVTTEAELDACTSDRVKTSRPARRFMENLQRKSQRWARNHGWRVE